MSNDTETLEAPPKRMKPVLFADERTDAERFDPKLHRGALDPSRVPGYSEQVQANDIAKADDLIFRDRNGGRTKEDLYKEIGASPGPLPVEFSWLRVSGAGGADAPSVLRELDHYTNSQGFRIARWPDDFEQHGYGRPPAARIAEDGTIRRGPDVALYVRSGEVARMWDAFKFEEQRRLEGIKAPDEYTAGGFSAEGFVEPEKHETLTVRH